MPKTFQLPHCDLPPVNEVCLGTMTMGSMNSTEESMNILDHYVFELGGNFLDVAEMYPVPVREDWAGRSEEIVGEWLASRTAAPSSKDSAAKEAGDKKRLKTLRREDIIIATKVAGPRFSGKAFVAANREKALGGAAPDPPVSPDYSRSQIFRACEASLKRLQTDYIDLYQLHWPERYVPTWGESQYLKEKEKEFQCDDVDIQGFETVVKTIGELLKSGKIRAWGLSNETSFGVAMFCEAAKRQGVQLPSSIQNDFSLCYRRFEDELAETCSSAHYDLRLLVYGALNGGVLSGKYHNGTATAKSRLNQFKKFQGRYRGPRSMEATKKYIKVAKEAGMSVATMAQAWCYDRHYVGAVIIGATSVRQLEENWKAADVGLDDATRKKIDEVHVSIRNPNLQD